jgi:D-beta-D-heptose 7-phosphate kinase/D-beta-D-heptose 1-phosphate adenosyltransferase
MILDASKYGDVIVVLNSDEWLIKKKGYVFMKWDERSEIIRSIRGVVNVVNTIDDDDETVCNTIRNLRRDVDLDYFANGGDRCLTNTPEMDVCKELNVGLLWNVGGEKVQSSQSLIQNAKLGKLNLDGIII